MFFLTLIWKRNCWNRSYQEAYVDKTDESGRFVAVTVKFIKKLSHPISLEMIKKIRN